MKPLFSQLSFWDHPQKEFLLTELTLGYVFFFKMLTFKVYVKHTHTHFPYLLTLLSASNTAVSCSGVMSLLTLLIRPWRTRLMMVSSRGWCNWSSRAHTAWASESETRVMLAIPNSGWTRAPPVASERATRKRLGVGLEEPMFGVRATSSPALLCPISKVRVPSARTKSCPATAGQIRVGPIDSAFWSSCESRWHKTVHSLIFTPKINFWQLLQ